MLASNRHFVMRYETPWKTESSQIMEAGVQAYTGLIVDDNYAQFRGDRLRFQFQINY